MRRAHATYFLTMAERAEPELAGPEAGIWLDRLGIEHDNLRGALAWAMERGDADTGLRLVAAVFRFWVVRGHLREGRAWAERLLALEPDDQDEVGRAEVGALGGAASGHGAARAGLRSRNTSAWIWSQYWRPRARISARSTGRRRSRMAVRSRWRRPLPRRWARSDASLAHGEPAEVARRLDAQHVEGQLRSARGIEMA